MIALISSAGSINVNDLTKIKIEFNNVNSVDTITPAHRKNLLKVLHSTRALDSTLKSILDFYGIRNTTYSLGQYLRQFERHTSPLLGRINPTERNKFQDTIIDLRNLYLHKADSYPRNDSAVNEIISEMHSLVSRIVSL